MAKKNKIGDTHKIKVLPKYFKDLLNQTKTFEVRKNDRDYKVNDILILKEWDKKRGYTGESTRRKISYALDNSDYCKEGFIILGLIVE